MGESGVHGQSGAHEWSTSWDSALIVCPPPALQARPDWTIRRHRVCCVEPGRKGPYFARMCTWIWFQYMCSKSLKNPCQDCFVWHRATLPLSQRIIFLIIHLIPSLGMAPDFFPIQPISRTSPPQANSSLAWRYSTPFVSKTVAKLVSLILSQIQLSGNE